MYVKAEEKGLKLVFCIYPRYSTRKYISHNKRFFKRKQKVLQKYLP